MNYLVTGGAGFIGSNLASALLAEGLRVRVLDNFLTGKKENLAGLAERYGDAFELVEGDLRDLEVTRRAAEGTEYVLHQGALPSVPRSVADPVLSSGINVGGRLTFSWRPGTPGSEGSSSPRLPPLTATRPSFPSGNR